MIKKTKKTAIKRKIKLSKTEGTKYIPEISHTASTADTDTDVVSKPKVDKLYTAFPSEDLNKVVEKINEIIDYI